MALSFLNHIGIWLFIVEKATTDVKAFWGIFRLTGPNQLQ